MRFSRVVLLTVLSVCFLAAVASAEVREETFARLKTQGDTKFSLFYFEGDEKGDAAVLALERAAAAFEADPVLSKGEKWNFVKINGRHPDNIDEFNEAGFKDEPGAIWLFTVTPGAGIVRFQHEPSESSMLRFIRDMNLPADADTVTRFTTEDALYDRMDETVPPRPAFVKFYEEWCSHCKALKNVFIQAATKLSPLGVDFVEVECSSTAATKAFCEANKAQSFPTLMLFTGEEKIRFEEGSRDVQSFERFFANKLGGAWKERWDASEASNGASSSSSSSGSTPAPKAAPKKAAPAPKKTEKKAAADVAEWDENSAKLASTVKEQEERIADLEQTLFRVLARIEKIEKKL